MEFIPSNGLNITAVSAPPYIVAGDTAQFTIKVRADNSPQPSWFTMTNGVSVYICKYDGTSPVFIANAAVSISAGKEVTISLTDITVPALPEFADMEPYAIMVTGTPNGKTFSCSPIATDAGTVLTEHRKPSINCTVDDASGLKDHFGYWISGYSSIRCHSTATPDTSQPGVYITRQELVIRSVKYPLVDGYVIIPNYEARTGGTLTWTVTAYASNGTTVSATGQMAFRRYTRPEISSLSVERYGVTYDESGNPRYEKDDTSDTVWINAGFAVTDISGMNPWSLYARWGEEENILIATGQAGSVTITEERSLLTQRFSAAVEWPITFTLSDEVTSVTAVYRLGKAGAIFDIEQHGVAVGMRSTANIARKMFECAWPAVFYDGAVDSEGEPIGLPRYSDDEIRIGLYNGRPLYRRCITLASVATQSSAAASEVDMGVTPAEVLEVSGWVYANGSLSGTWDIPFNCYQSSTNMAVCAPMRDYTTHKFTGKLKCWCPAGNRGGKITIIYIKEDNA